MLEASLLVAKLALLGKCDGWSDVRSIRACWPKSAPLPSILPGLDWETARPNDGGGKKNDSATQSRPPDDRVITSIQVIPSEVCFHRSSYHYFQLVLHALHKMHRYWILGNSVACVPFLLAVFGGSFSDLIQEKKLSLRLIKILLMSRIVRSNFLLHDLCLLGIFICVVSLCYYYFFFVNKHVLSPTQMHIKANRSDSFPLTTNSHRLFWREFLMRPRSRNTAAFRKNLFPWKRLPCLGVTVLF